MVALLQALPKLNAVTLASVLPDASDAARHLLASLLEWDPDRRPSAASALSHPFVATYRNPDDEVCVTPGRPSTLPRDRPSLRTRCARPRRAAACVPTL